MGGHYTTYEVRNTRHGFCSSSKHSCLTDHSFFFSFLFIPQCAVHGFGDADSLRDVRRQVKERMNPPSVKPVGPRLRVQRGAFKDARMAGYSYPFMGSDASVVKSSQVRNAMCADRKSTRLNSSH